jgi:hypothetical protein
LIENGCGSATHTYMKALLIQGDKAKVKWHQKGSTDEPYEDHIATKTHVMIQPLYKWVRSGTSSTPQR